jgi:23S rRNA (cytosine1962-C5)-methyltransferase
VTNEITGRVILKPGREKSLLKRHPWVFSGAISEMSENVPQGNFVDIMSSDGRWLARGAYSPTSQIRVRAWTFDQEMSIDSAFIRARLSQAVEKRTVLLKSKNISAFRIVFGESDGLPGVIVDRYSDFIVCQFLSLGADVKKNEIVAAVRQSFPSCSIYERSDVDVRLKEGLTMCTGVLAGETPPDLVQITENNLRFWVDIKSGHKTGFYLDQRDNRALISDLAKNTRMLNCFSYTGGFAVAGLAGGAAHVTNVDSSRTLLDLTTRNIALNGLNVNASSTTEGDVFSVLRDYRNTSTSFDFIVLDPPKFADSKSQLDGACRGYKDINLLAFKLLRPNGMLMTFSCSGLVSRELFQQIVAGAALDAGRSAQIVQWLSQSADHPVALNFPESAYLKGLVCRVE